MFGGNDAMGLVFRPPLGVTGSLAVQVPSRIVVLTIIPILEGCNDNGHQWESRRLIMISRLYLNGDDLFIDEFFCSVTILHSIYTRFGQT